MKIIKKKNLDRLISFGTSPSLMFYCTFILIILLCVGTWYQKDIGIYQAHKKFFSSWFVKNNFFLPIPGTRLVLFVMISNLCFKLIFKNIWSWQKFGINLTHLGVLVLLLGGVYTAFFSKEGSMAVVEGSSSNVVESYHRFELAVINHSDDEFDDLVVFSDSMLRSENEITHKKLPFKIKVKNFYKNAKLVNGALENVFKPKGMTSLFHLKESIYNPDGGENNAGLFFELHEKGKSSESKNGSNKSSEVLGDGSYILLQNSPIKFKILYKNVSYSFVLRNLRWYPPLPFTIELKDFTKEFHPSSDIPRSFKSEVFIKEGGISQRAIIKMNHPFRKNNFTIYQLRYIDTVPEISVFAVVDNSGKFLPYLASLIICSGILIHFLIMVLHKKRSRIILK